MPTIKKLQGFAPSGGSRGRVLSQFLLHLAAPAPSGSWPHPSSLHLCLHAAFPTPLSLCVKSPSLFSPGTCPWA